MTELLLTQVTHSLRKQGLFWLMLLGPLFFLSYGQVYTFTDDRDVLGSLVFGWERSVPFIPCAIVPYWSIDLLYGISLFILSFRPLDS